MLVGPSNVGHSLFGGHDETLPIAYGPGRMPGPGRGCDPLLTESPGFVRVDPGVPHVALHGDGDGNAKPDIGTDELAERLSVPLVLRQ